MLQILSQINKHSDRYVLKGGTSLLFCYGLNRFSEDIDLDAVGTTVGINRILGRYKWNYWVAKDTKTVKRYMVHYGGEKPLKIEISYRNNAIDSSRYYRHSNGILVYDIDNITMLKIKAFDNRDKIRDLFDLVFICQNYWGTLCTYNQNNIIESFVRKGLEYFDYLCKTQNDEFIDKEILGYNFLDVLNKLGLL